jgi:hypothetical protein
MTGVAKRVLRWGGLTAAAAGAAGAVAVRRGRAQVRGNGKVYAVTINLPAEKLCPRGEHWTPPLADVAAHAKLTMEPAPDGRGTQVLAVADDPDCDVRGRLRAAKQLLETGEELLAPPEPSGRGPLAQRLTYRIDSVLGAGGRR